jgi:hypothetical protein
MIAWPVGFFSAGRFDFGEEHLFRGRACHSSAG